MCVVNNVIKNMSVYEYFTTITTLFNEVAKVHCKLLLCICLLVQSNHNL